MTQYWRVTNVQQQTAEPLSGVWCVVEWKGVCCSFEVNQIILKEIELT